MRFLVTDLGKDEVVLGYPWLVAFQPKIDWKNVTLDEDMQPVIIKSLGLDIDKEVAKIREAWVNKAKTLATPGEEVYVAQLEMAKLRKTSTATQMAVKAKDKDDKPWNEIVPKHYHWMKRVFSKEEAK